MSYECPTIQAVMTAAYDRWQAAEKMTKKQFMEQLSDKEAFAVRIGNLNYQVENGGFSQYWGNSYAMGGNVAALLGYTREIAAWAATQSGMDPQPVVRVRELLGIFNELMGENDDPNGRSWKTPGGGWYEDDEDGEEAFMSEIESRGLDRSYYAVNDAFMNLAEAYFVATFK